MTFLPILFVMSVPVAIPFRSVSVPVFAIDPVAVVSTFFNSGPPYPRRLIG